MRQNPRFREGKSPSRFASGHIAGLGVWGRNAWNANKSAVRKQIVNSTAHMTEGWLRINANKCADNEICDGRMTLG